MLVAACTLTARPTPRLPTIGSANSTNLNVTVTVNGVAIGNVQPGERIRFVDRPLPALPWTVTAQSPSGRALTVLDVPLDHTPGSFNRSDLSCGAVLLWVGEEPIFGPSPPSFGPEGPGQPGDCAP